MPVVISHSKMDSVVLVSLQGTLVAGKDAELLTKKTLELLEAHETRIILDLGQLTYIDSTGISALVRAYTLVKSRSGSMKLVHLTKRVYDVLRITRLSSVFEIYDDLQKALASFGSGPELGAPARPGP